MEPIVKNQCYNNFSSLEIRNYITKKENTFPIRIGINSGPVVDGIVGVKKYAYDIWGDTVNIASRMESNGETGKINVSNETFALIKDKFSCEDLGMIEAKGNIKIWLVESLTEF